MNVYYCTLETTFTIISPERLSLLLFFGRTVLFGNLSIYCGLGVIVPSTGRGTGVLWAWFEDSIF